MSYFFAHEIKVHTPVLQYTYAGVSQSPFNNIKKVTN